MGENFPIIKTHDDDVDDDRLQNYHHHHHGSWFMVHQKQNKSETNMNT